MEVDSETPVAAAVATTTETETKKSPQKTEVTSPAKEESPSPAKSIPTVGEHKKNGTLANIAAAAASNAASVKKEESKSFLSGVVVQFPEMFSMKRDRHILDKFGDAADIRMQKIAFVECESEEAAIKLQAELNNTAINNKKMTVSRLDTAEKNVLYLGALKQETTDDILKTQLPGIEEIRREKYNTFILFSGESECRAARAKVQKGGINGQNLHCDFDLRKDRFKPAEEPAAKKPKEDEAKEKETTESKPSEKKEESTEEAKTEEADAEEAKPAEDETNVKADEW